MHNQRFAFTFAAAGRCLEARASTREPAPLKIFDQKKEVFFFEKFGPIFLHLFWTKKGRFP